MKEIPHVLNPEKGFVVTANNRVVLDNVKNDAGATFMSTARAERITEVIEGHIKNGHKMEVSDMIAIQQDVGDTMARRITEFILPIATQNINLLKDEKQKAQVNSLVEVLKGWNGDMEMELIEPTVYHTWIYYMYKSLFNDMMLSDDSIMALLSNYPFKDFMFKMLKATLENSKDSKYNRACKAAYPEF